MASALSTIASVPSPQYAGSLAPAEVSIECEPFQRAATLIFI
jgi:hypothetical protein